MTWVEQFINDWSIVRIVDFALVALIVYQIYKLIRGTVAIKIFVGIVAIYTLWKVVTALEMQLLSEILGQIIGVCVIALLILFQQELRQFLVLIGNRRFLKGKPAFIQRWFSPEGPPPSGHMVAIVAACQRMAKSKTGALIVVARKADPAPFILSSKRLDARISSTLIETIFFKNSPLHDGAVIIKNGRISSAGAVLPISESAEMMTGLGMRHRAAIGMSEQTDALVIVVSEERGELSYALHGELIRNVQPDKLQEVLHASE